MHRSLFIKGFIVFISVVLFFGLLYNYLGWSGTKVVHYVVGDSSPFVQSLLPDARVSKPENGSVKLLDEPVYFSVFAPPGNWQTADVKLSFKTGNRAILEFGALKDLFAQAYDYRPFANSIISNLDPKEWVSKPATNLGEDMNVFVRQTVIDIGRPTITDSQVAVYKATLQWAEAKGKTQAKKDITYAFPLQGPHELFTAIGDRQPFKLTINYHDLNLAPGSDEGSIKVISQTGETVTEQAFIDDGDILGNGASSTKRTVVVAPDGLSMGVYKIVLSATSDIVFDEFITKNTNLVLKNSFTLAPHAGKILFNTNSKKVIIEPLAATGLGAGTFGKSAFILDTVKNKTVVTSADKEVTALTLPGGSVKVTGEGFYSLGKNLFFQAEVSSFTNFLVAPNSYNMLIAYSPKVIKEGDWQTGTSSFDLNTLAKERGAYKFALSAPLVKETEGNVEVHAIDIVFKKPAITFRSIPSSLKSFLKDLIW